MIIEYWYNRVIIVDKCHDGYIAKQRDENSFGFGKSETAAVESLIASMRKEADEIERILNE